MADGGAGIDVVQAEAQGRLKSVIERIERLEEDKAGIAGDIKEVYAEAKGEGFDIKVIRKIVRLRKQDKASVSGDLKEVYAEAKGEGFDSKIIRKVIRIRKQDVAKRQEEEALLDLYISAIGGL